MFVCFYWPPLSLNPHLSPSPSLSPSLVSPSLRSPLVCLLPVASWGDAPRGGKELATGLNTDTHTILNPADRRAILRRTRLRSLPKHQTPTVPVTTPDTQDVPGLSPLSVLYVCVKQGTLYGRGRGLSLSCVVAPLLEPLWILYYSCSDQPVCCQYCMYGLCKTCIKVWFWMKMGFVFEDVFCFRKFTLETLLLWHYLMLPEQKTKQKNI